MQAGKTTWPASFLVEIKQTLYRSIKALQRGLERRRPANEPVDVHRPR